MQAAYVERSTALAAGDFVLQKRAPEVPTKKQLPAKHERKATMEMDGGSVSGRDSAHEGFGTIEDNISGSLADGSRVEPPSSFADRAKEHAGYNAGADPIVMNGSGSSGADVKFWGQDSRMCVDAQGQRRPSFLNAPLGNLLLRNLPQGRRRRRRRRRRRGGGEEEEELGVEMCSDQVATGKGGASFGRAAGASVQVGVPPREDSQIEHQKTDNGAGSSWLPESPGMPTTIGTGNTELKLPQLLGDLQAVALDPFHGVDSRTVAFVQQAILKFRSAVYQKSLALSIPSGMEFEEVHACSKSPAGSTLGSDNRPLENTKDLPSLKSPKLVVRPDDPTKSGRKRGPSDRREELAAKRIKKISDLKSLATEKAALKISEAKGDGKETVALRLLKPVQPDFLKKTGSPVMAREPTVLVMKFPPNSSLPSSSELKARHLSGQNTLSGNVNVRCLIRPLAESKVQPEDALTDSVVELKLPAPQPAVLLKSCLKKPTGDEVGTATDGGKKDTSCKICVGGGRANDC
ncbi:hypothetical protein Acr_07g0007790 [Actinidia rufa]|uniref:Uncharacterized protein n=1 Tax=Actinidia rufa TaxID=165716 RepID=A0A7J0EW38_9ERIC|nr:hypothetical protein Acr_07g0007790 [Actinidia rufa]